MGSPDLDLSWSYFVPAVSTVTLLTTVRVMTSSAAPPPPVRAVTSTSTSVPGTTNPATPTTSFTRTEMARMPSGMTGGSPAPASSEATLVIVIGSFSAIGVITPRLTSSLGSLNEPATGLRDGHGTTL